MNTQILNISRRVGLLDLFKDQGFKVGVEVGTDHGQYARDICSRLPHLKLYTIDPYLPYTEGKDVRTQVDVDQIRREAKELLKPYNCEMIRKTSMEAVKDFKDNSIDFVFIDGNHEYEYVLEDIIEWTSKVRRGGIVCGHDYKKDEEKKYGVIKAVDLYVKLNNLDLYILRKGSFVDCWLFFKK